MKKMLHTAIIGLLTITLSCNKKDKSLNVLVGTWQVADVSVKSGMGDSLVVTYGMNELLPGSYARILQFNSDNTLEYTDSMTSGTGAYKIDGSRLYTDPPSVFGIPTNYTTFSEPASDQLVFTNSGYRKEGGDSVWNLQKIYFRKIR